MTIDDIDFTAASPDDVAASPDDVQPDDQRKTPEVDNLTSGLPAPASFSTDMAASKAIAVKVEVDALLKQSQSISIITNDEAFGTVADLATLVRKLAKRVDQLSHYFTDPHTRYNQQVRAFFKVYQDPLSKAEMRLRYLMKNYQVMQDNERRRRQAEMDRHAAELTAKAKAEAEADAERGVVYDPSPIVAPVAPPPPTTVRTEHGTVYQRSDWTWEVEDLDKVPEKFILKKLDEVKVRAAIRGGDRAIPGLRIFQDVTPAIRVN